MNDAPVFICIRRSVDNKAAFLFAVGDGVDLFAFSTGLEKSSDTNQMQYEYE